MDRAWWVSAFAIVVVMGGGVVGMMLYVLSVTH
nr:MAG TPA: FAD binding domain [Caudoviricetes sp.]